MKVTINAEFTDDELKKHAADVGRKVGLDFIRDLVKTLSRLKISPGIGAVLEQALSGALGSKSGGPVPPPSMPDFAAADDRCLRIEPSPISDEGWSCCHCTTYNGIHRPACRQCGHGRCDVIVPPPPPPRRTDPFVQ